MSIREYLRPAAPTPPLTRDEHQRTWLAEALAALQSRPLGAAWMEADAAEDTAPGAGVTQIDCVALANWLHGRD